MSTRSSRHTPRSQKRPPPPPPCAASRLLRWSFRVQVPARVRHAQVPARGVMAFKMSTRNSRHTPRPQKSPPPPSARCRFSCRDAGVVLTCARFERACASSTRGSSPVVPSLLLCFRCCRFSCCWSGYGSGSDFGCGHDLYCVLVANCTIVMCLAIVIVFAILTIAPI